MSEKHLKLTDCGMPRFVVLSTIPAEVLERLRTGNHVPAWGRLNLGGAVPFIDPVKANSTPKPPYHGRAGMPASQRHAEFELWAQSQARCDIRLWVKYPDGSENYFDYRPVTEEVGYMVDGELYEVAVDTSKLTTTLGVDLPYSDWLKSERIWFSNDCPGCVVRREALR